MSKTFCVFPFFNLNSNTDGSVKLCCNIRENKHIKKNNGAEYKLGDDSIDDVWHSDYLNTVRQKMLDGEEVDECRDCYRHEAQTGSSSRTSSNVMWGDKDFVKTNIVKFQKKEQLDPVSSLELRLGNTCNLACNSCWGYSSSKFNDEKIRILKEDGELSNKFKARWYTEYFVPRDINHWYKSEQYSKNINSVSQNLKRLYVTGGEPTLIKENRTLLKKLLDNNNSDCFVSFTTNGTVADSELLELLKLFPNNEIQISLDGIGEQAHYVRYPTVWKEVDENIKKFCAIENIKIVFYTVISAYNLFSVQQIWEYLDALAKERAIGWYPILLDNPPYMHTHIWDLSYRILASEKLKDKMRYVQYLRKYVSDDAFNKVISFYTSDILSLDLSENIDEFLELNKILDKHRHTDFEKTFPELMACLS